MPDDKDDLDKEVGAILSGQTGPGNPPPPTQSEADRLNQAELNALAPKQGDGSTPGEAAVNLSHEDTEPATSISSGDKPFYRGLDFYGHPSAVYNRLDWCDFILLYSKALNQDDISWCRENSKALGVIFEINTHDVDGDGEAHARLFLEQMDSLGIKPLPQSVVWVAADIDLTAPTAVVNAVTHFLSFERIVSAAGWTLGVYGNGALEIALSKQDGVVVRGWSAGAKGWYDTKLYDSSGAWSINQGPQFTHGGVWPQPGALRLGPQGNFCQPQSWPNIGVPYDPDIALSLDWAI